jgi:hypothetical protein
MITTRKVDGRNMQHELGRREMNEMLQPEKWKGSERLGGIGVEKLTLGWIVNTLYECRHDLSGTRVDRGRFF